MPAWSSRPAVVAGTVSVDGLGTLVEQELSRVDGMLFTATAREDLDELARFQQLKDAAFCGQLRAIVAMVARMPAANREFAHDEVALALNTGLMTAGLLLDLALEAAELPGLLEAVEGGRWTERHLRTVVSVLNEYDLTLEQRQAIVLIVLARYVDETPGELAKLLKRVVLRVDRSAQASRKRQADRKRFVHFGLGVDGQATLYAVGPAEKVAEIRAAVDAALATEAGPGGSAEDDRPVGARSFDALHRLMTGGTEAGAWVAHVLIPYSTLLGGDLEVAEVPGLGPILPATAADLAAQAVACAQLAVDPRNGELLAVTDLLTVTAVATPPATSPVAGVAPVWAPLLGATLHHDPATSSYRPNPRLRRFLEARDRTCAFPGCGRPASQTDKDHRIPWPLGPTTRANMHCLCRHHHRAKQATYTVTVDPDGNTLWTNTGGWTFTRRPKGY